MILSSMCALVRHKAGSVLGLHLLSFINWPRTFFLVSSTIGLWTKIERMDMLVNSLYLFRESDNGRFLHVKR